MDRGIFKELKEPELFYSAKAIEGTIQWQNKADFCPDTLYLESKPIDRFFIEDNLAKNYIISLPKTFKSLPCVSDCSGYPTGGQWKEAQRVAQNSK
ncbi:MAG: DUF2442 domain-containing protein [Breznakibacter sp.]|nr:DUF2442 domain-containing protein [Breznakibacter sp.]